MITLQEAKDYLRVDFENDDALIGSLVTTADSYLQGSIGKDYNKEDARAKTLALLVIADLYDQRSLNDSAKLSNNIRRLVDDFSLQMRLELRKNVVAES